MRAPGRGQFLSRSFLLFLLLLARSPFNKAGTKRSEVYFPRECPGCSDVLCFYRREPRL